MDLGLSTKKRLTKTQTEKWSDELYFWSFLGFVVNNKNKVHFILEVLLRKGFLQWYNLSNTQKHSAT